jgi:hypothetical protein
LISCRAGATKRRRETLLNGGSPGALVGDETFGRDRLRLRREQRRDLSVFPLRKL